LIPIRYGIVGNGWRAQFFLRLARLMPDRFTVTRVVTRTGTLDELDAGAPDFVITAVPWQVNPGTVEALVGMGRPVLSETPPAPDLAGLRSLWSRVGGSGLVQVAEQYLLLPGHAARLALVRGGILGTPTSAQVSSTHGYHAVSMLRAFLGAGFASATVRGYAHTAPLADPLTRDGWRGDGTVLDATTTIATLDFGDTLGLYDFTDNQWWNPLRSRRIVVRASHGELVDDRVVRLVDPRTPVESTLIRRQTGHDLNLEGADLDHISFDGATVYRNMFFGARLSDEDIAIATLLDRTGAWCRGDGPPPYPLAEACQDHLLALAIEAAVTSGNAVVTGREGWAG
jgi:predicted dehydrogenase